MNIRFIRNILLILLFLILSIIYYLWQSFDDTIVKKKYILSKNITENSKQKKEYLTKKYNNTDYFQYPKIRIKTDVLDINLNLLNGNISYAALLKYPNKLHSKNPIVLLDNKGNKYIAESGIYSEKIPEKIIFNTKNNKNFYKLIPKEKQLKVNLYWKKNKISIIKEYIFTRGKYDIIVNYIIKNDTQKPFTVKFYNQLVRKIPDKKKNFFFSYSNDMETAISTSNEHFQKITFKEISKKNLNLISKGGWIAMIQHYFISAWIPNTKQENLFYTKDLGNNIYCIGLENSKNTVYSNSKIFNFSKIYIGPAKSDYLASVAPHLELTINYGFLWFISLLIFHTMSWIYNIVGNWGWSIVLVTLLIKLIFYPLSAKSYRAMAKMRNLQPKIQGLKDRLANDKKALGQAIIELYKKEKVNPLGGCLPILIQIPVFIGLYYMLVYSVELRQAPWAFWIHDLSVKDPYYILPIIMGISMLIQQKMNPSNSVDSLQEKILLIIPIVFTLMFLSMPSGLIIYWTVNNFVTILQQWYIINNINNKSNVAK